MADQVPTESQGSKQSNEQKAKLNVFGWVKPLRSAFASVIPTRKVDLDADTVETPANDTAEAEATQPTEEAEIKLAYEECAQLEAQKPFVGVDPKEYWAYQNRVNIAAAARLLNESKKFKKFIKSKGLTVEQVEEKLYAPNEPGSYGSERNFEMRYNGGASGAEVVKLYGDFLEQQNLRKGRNSYTKKKQIKEQKARVASGASVLKK